MANDNHILLFLSFSTEFKNQKKEKNNKLFETNKQKTSWNILGRIYQWIDVNSNQKTKQNIRQIQR